MTDHAVTLTLPGAVYEQIERAAEKAHLPVHDLLVEYDVSNTDQFPPLE